ncbi:MAG: DUF4276 family protein [Armatimonadetes bacterium]|nr:DUF4276 family protein [Armatimonadota bacterium]
MKRVLMLVEGQTEERFVKDVLQPHLLTWGVYAEPKIIATRRIKSGGQFKGGITQFRKVEDDLRRLLGDTGAAMVTTVFDYYKFPKDFTGWEDVTARQPAQRVDQLEQAMERYFNHPRFHSYFMLHEYEALLFTSPETIAKTLNEPARGQELQSIRDACSGPEKINEGEETHPSRRLENLFPGYRKPLHGPLIIGRIGLNQVRASCPHFNDWLCALEALGTTQ